MNRALLNRLREPSTWAGIATLAALVGVPTETFNLVSQVVMGAAGLFAIILPEKAA